MEHSAKIFVAGHRGMVGSAIVRRLRSGGFTNLLTRTHAELDLLDQRAVHEFLARAETAAHLAAAQALLSAIESRSHG